MQSPGLRERKKQKTRWAIQEHAMRLFAEQGFDATTVDQIAAAAEVSPSTFFRYFKTKEDVVVQDEYDDVIAEQFVSAPPELTPVGALRHVMHHVFANLTADDKQAVADRTQLILSVPALRARTLQNLLDTMNMLGGLIAGRLGRPRDDFQAQIIAGAVVGAATAAMEAWLANPVGDDFFQLIDRAFEVLEPLTGN
jgi:AcrR family transcriptional regulator